MSERTRIMWDELYLSLIDAQDTAMKVLGDEKAGRLYRLLGDARAEAERAAPGGWSTLDVGKLPVGDPS